ncbi:L,D-transpeptidase [Gracilibacillus sp. YIM 98692]|uniref:L,D-transpeptidase n=1 Tax=Gracilibacillus sp. YIM 98692 TaxID=2663532 RepID=UPI0013D605A6|nr:L,D-transpeptidase [Gracilibacillus sp. YIM 98692]
MNQTKRWNRGDVILLVIIFYLLGILTPIIWFIVSNGSDTTSPDQPTTLPYIINELEKTREGKGDQALIEGNLMKLNQTEVSHSKKDLLWESTTVLRSALYQYVKHTGTIPSDLSTLVKEQYVTDLPLEPTTHSNEVVQAFTGEGGWHYQPSNVQESETVDGLAASIEQALKPNLTLKNDLDSFQPIILEISKDEHTLILKSGSSLIRQYKVGLGENSRTPAGVFTITDKVPYPNQAYYPTNDNPYGTRAMQLSNPIYAIHGTNNPDSIGEDVSQGCVRLHNQDVEELYAMVPLHSTVYIKGNVDTEESTEDTNVIQGEIEEMASDLYNHNPSPKPVSSFRYWAH